MKNFDRQMRGSPEAEKAYALAALNSRNSQAAEADNSGTQQRRSTQVVQLFVQWINKIVARNGILGVAAIDAIAGENGRIAKILTAAPAVGTTSIYAAHPRNSDASAQWQLIRGPIFNGTDNLVPGN
jgi:hypothetical protein